MALGARYAELDALLGSLHSAQQRQAEFTERAEAAEAELAALFTEISVLEAQYDFHARAAVDASERASDALGDLACIRTALAAAAAAAAAADEAASKPTLTDAATIANTVLAPPTCKAIASKAGEGACLTETEIELVDTHVRALAPVTRDGMEVAAAYVAGCYGIGCSDPAELGASIAASTVTGCTVCVALHAAILARCAVSDGVPRLDNTVIDAVDAAIVEIARLRQLRAEHAAAAAADSSAHPTQCILPAADASRGATALAPRRSAFVPSLASSAPAADAAQPSERPFESADAPPARAWQIVPAVAFATQPVSPRERPVFDMQAPAAMGHQVAPVAAAATATISATRRRPRARRPQMVQTSHHAARAAYSSDPEAAAFTQRPDSFWDDGHGHDDWGS
jgi:hypothetical protein